MGLFDELARASEVFYTSDVLLYEPERLTSPAGDRYTRVGALIGNVKCNMQPLSCEAAQRQYGVTIDEGWRISCRPDARLKPGVFALWRGITYRIRAALHPPSHTHGVLEKEAVPHESGG